MPTPELLKKLHPSRFPGMSPLMAAIVGYVLGQSYTMPGIAELSFSGAENLVYIRKVGGVGFDGSKTCGTIGIDCWTWQG